MDEINAIARVRDIAVIEDAACAIGTTYKGKYVGGLGDIGCFSFHPRKVVTTGEGGMVTTNRDDLAVTARSRRNHGAAGQPDPSLEAPGPWTMARFDELGFNLRLSDIQAAVGVAQMAKLDALLAERRRLGASLQRTAYRGEFDSQAARRRFRRSYLPVLCRSRVGRWPSASQLCHDCTGQGGNSNPPWYSCSTSPRILCWQVRTETGTISECGYGRGRDHNPADLSGDDRPRSTKGRSGLASV